MQHLVVSLEELSEFLENSLINQGVMTDSLTVDECVFDIVSYLLTTPNRLAVLPVATILKIYFNIDQSNLLELSKEVRTSFFDEIRDIDLRVVKNYAVQNRTLLIDGVFDLR